MIVVTAATGEFGRLVVDSLVNRVPAGEVAVAVRNPGKAEDLAGRGVQIRFGEYDEPGSLREAFAGVDRLLFISSPDIGAREDQHRNVVTAARDAGVGLLVYTSGLGADVIDEGVLGEHHATELLIGDSGLPHTFLRHPIYSDFFIHPGLRAAVEAGELTSSTGGRGMNTAFRTDLADAAATVLTSGDHAGRGYNFTGPLWAYPQLAAVLGEISGRSVSYRELDADQGVMEMIGPVIRAGGFEVQTEDLQRILGRPATSLEDAVAAVLR